MSLCGELVGGLNVKPALGKPEYHAARIFMQSGMVAISILSHTMNGGFRAGYFQHRMSLADCGSLLLVFHRRKVVRLSLNYYT